MKATDQDKVYRELILEPLRKCADYTPKFGQGQGENGYTLEDFERVYGADPLYSWIGFDSPLMYAAHKAAGGMTSLYRQLGIGCERLFRQVIRDQLGLTAEQANWSYEVAEESGTVRTLYLDGRILLQDIQSTVAKKRVATWLKEMRAKLKILTPIEGAVFEVRQGYKSKDSKRQNADLHNAAQAIAEKYIPVLTIMSSQLDADIRLRYEVGKWGVLAGVPGLSDETTSTFAFSKKVLGYDLQDFFERNKKTLRTEVSEILSSLLKPQ
ncbi:MAG: hypothetical protein A3B27_01440 [Candidatus Taylorbacteria bacterium RIFCSPLOWO2_01_FULL_50_130]|nr:MAG: hypothetical protein A3B27_01440 [Candidatus Taylorbacteria bacterium RIFCSPLOWO2_01_FULL_50_130]OHA45856.1 MAG: hypothetical protein A3G61_03605 [Candidatus Taylorbacteria bacterium RIFCSPLOWO2_12_FULL_49_67]